MKIAETELKLTLPVKKNAAFKRLVAERLAKTTTPRTTRLFTIYFDTPSLDLAKAGLALWLQRTDGQWIQTLRQKKPAGAGLHRCTTQESRVQGQSLELNKLELNKIARRKPQQFLLQTHIAAALQPRFITDIERTRWNLQDAHGNAVAVSLDQGSIKSGQRTLQLNEVEIKLKHGEVQALFELASAWAATLTLIPETTTTAERGYALSQGDVARAASSARIPQQKSKSTPYEAMHSVALESLRHLRANVPGILAGEDLEFVHQARVALRRLRSAYKVFGDSAARDWQTIMSETRWLASLLGNVRDLDVLLTETLPPIEAALALEIEFIPFKKAVIALRDQHRRTLRSALISSRYAMLMLLILRVLNDPPPKPEGPCKSLRRFARRALNKRWRQVEQRASKWRAMDREQRHDLRKRTKKLRYAIEFLSPLYARNPTRRYLKKLQQLQQVLGLMNDETVAQKLIANLVKTHPSLKHTGGLIAGWLAATEKKSETELDTVIKKFEKAAKFWSRKNK
ncbi:MAG TPA: CYTH and CHAD domain-containing protein [Spongiibacteraceae bacterium]|nr:CYTH and CHAD domain-containing protein [Spongiibacteraceae bacterium]